MFKFARGTGLMGEAGPEAIMPLSRTTSGDLGVKVDGGVGGKIENNIGVSVTINSDGTAQTSVETSKQQGKEIGNLISAKIKQTLIEEQRPGGLLNRR